MKKPAPLQLTPIAAAVKLLCLMLKFPQLAVEFEQRAGLDE